MALTGFLFPYSLFCRMCNHAHSLTFLLLLTPKLRVVSFSTPRMGVPADGEKGEPVFNKLLDGYFAILNRRSPSERMCPGYALCALCSDLAA